MKNIAIIIVLAGLLIACKKEDTTPEPLKVRTVSGAWASADGGAGGINNFTTFKNYQYNFEVGSDNQIVEIKLSSPVINIQFALFDPNGQLIASTTSTSQIVSDSRTFNKGIYRLVISAARRAVGNFEYTIMGINGNPTKIESQILASGIQNWGSLGGGGISKTFKNHFYTFEVIEDNKSVDLELESADTDVALILYDELGVKVATKSGSRNVFTISAAKKGTYTVMAGTDFRGAVGNYSLRVFGKVNNLQKIISQTNSTKGSLSGSSKLDQFNYPYDTYSIQLTPNSSNLDIEMTSSDMFVELYLASNSGVKISNNVQTFLQNKSYYLVYEDLPAGVYTVTTRSHNRSYGTYTLNVFGQFTDFKKL